MFVVRGFVGDGTSGRPKDMWLWNVAPWRRLCAEAGLRAAEEATAPPTYLDGRPRQRAREMRVQDKGFAHPDSAPNTFTLDEWRVMTAGRQQEGRTEQQRQQRLLTLGMFSWAAEAVNKSYSSECIIHSDGRAEEEGSLPSLSDSHSSPTGTAVGLLDPGLFDACGRLLQGDCLLAAQSKLERKEQQQWQEKQQRERKVHHQQLLETAQADSVPDLAADELACRDGWDWKVGPSIMCAL